MGVAAMMMKQTYQTYKQQSVMTMTSAEMLTMLYDGVLKELYLVRKAFEVKDYAEINRGLQKIQRILNHLKSSLDLNFDIAKNLMSLYDYCGWIVTQANLKKDPARLDEVAEMVGQLKDSYIQADKKVRMHA
jgi:flagellar protein FliS